MTELRGRITLVTGASRGIGRAVAIALAEAGAHVAVNYRVEEQEAQRTLELMAPAGTRTIMAQADVSRSSDVTRLIEIVQKELGPIEILVNNAGMARHQPIESITEADWDDVINVNLKSAFLVTQAVLPGMRARRWGRIINVTSGAAQTGGIVGPHYTASKAGMEGLTRAYAARLVKEGITVNSVAPALIKTDMSQDPESLRKLIPMDRLGRTEEVGEAVVFAASNDYMTGQTLHLNGGLYFG